MLRSVIAVATLPALVIVAGCVHTTPAPQTTQVIVQPPAVQVQAVAPVPPPPANAELVPPPPLGGGPVVWQPGHWRYTGIAGNPWAWVQGQYMPPPMGMTAWQPGRWMQAPSGGWQWDEGHWS